MNSPDTLVCPSYRCVSGAMLIGIVQADHTVAFLGNPVRVDQQFVQIARQGRPPEKRFRFAGTCGEGACVHWAGRACALAERLSRSSQAAAAELPDCGIRQWCRWYAEQGGAACRICPHVVRGSELDSQPEISVTSTAEAPPALSS